MYKLLDGNGKTYLSAEPGTLGGHRGLKIFGRLDCPSALRFITAGKYIRHRVFFADFTTAIVAGYRPCAKCMPRTHALWRDDAAWWIRLIAQAKTECAAAKAALSAAKATKPGASVPSAGRPHPGRPTRKPRREREKAPI